MLFKHNLELKHKDEMKFLKSKFWFIFRCYCLETSILFFKFQVPFHGVYMSFCVFCQCIIEKDNHMLKILVEIFFIFEFLGIYEFLKRFSISNSKSSKQINSHESCTVLALIYKRNRKVIMISSDLFLSNNSGSQP